MYQVYVDCVSGVVSGVGMEYSEKVMCHFFVV